MCLQWTSSSERWRRWRARFACHIYIDWLALRVQAFIIRRKVTYISTPIASFSFIGNHGIHHFLYNLDSYKHNGIQIYSVVCTIKAHTHTPYTFLPTHIINSVSQFSRITPQQQQTHRLCSHSHTYKSRILAAV